MAINTATFAKLMEPKYRKIFFEEYEAKAPIYDKVFKVEDADKKTMTDYRIAGAGDWNVKVEGADVTYEDVYPGDEVTYTSVTYEKALQITEEMIEDDQYNVIDKFTRELGRTGKIKVESIAADVFNNGFTTTGYDSVALFADAHPNRGGAGGTQDNLGTAAALSDASLKAGIIAMEGQRNEANQLVQVEPNQLMVPKDLRFTALEITQSDKKSGTVENDKNTLTGLLEVIVWHYLTSTTAWFLRDSLVAQNLFFWRVKPQFKSMVDFDSGNGKYKGRMRFSVGYSDWRGLYGNAGA